MKGDGFTVTIDAKRSIGAEATGTGTAVLTLEDPQTIAIVEMGPEALQKTIDGLLLVQRNLA